MKKYFTASFALFLLATWAPSLAAAPADEVLSAAKKLSESGGYSWTAEREGSRFWRGVVKGKVRKDGAALVENPGRDNTYLTAFQGEPSAAETQDGWQSAESLYINGDTVPLYSP